MTQDTSYDSDSGYAADRVVAALHRIDEKVDEMSRKRKADPESMGDKLFKSAAPALAGLLAGRMFQSLWNRGVTRRGLDKDAAGMQGVLLSVAFAAASAALGSLISQLSTRGSQALVDRRHRKHAK